MDKATIAVEARAVDGQEGVMEFVASTNHVDRAGDIVEQNWDMKSFRKNPVFLYGHSYSDLPVGKIVKVWTEKVESKAAKSPGSRRTMIRVKFVPSDIHPFAETVRRMYDGGFLKAVSVGFRPLERGDVSAEERDALGMGQYGQRFTKSELLEVSAVTVPMNAEALSTGVQRGWYGDDTTEHQAVSPREGADFNAILCALDSITTEDVDDVAPTAETQDDARVVVLLAAAERIEAAADRIEAQLEDDLQLSDIPVDPDNHHEEDAGSLPAEEIEMDVTEEDLEEALASFSAATDTHNNLESQ